MTTSGIRGVSSAIADGLLPLEVAPGVRLQSVRAAIARRMNEPEPEESVEDHADAVVDEPEVDEPEVDEPEVDEPGVDDSASDEASIEAAAISVREPAGAPADGEASGPDGGCA